MMRRLDRRAVFASGAAAALLAATGVSADAPRRGGHLRIAVADSAGMQAVARRAVFETLTEVAPDGVLRPALALDWQGSPDARDWRIRLRDDAVFHDGTPVTARDVIATVSDQVRSFPAQPTRIVADGTRLAVTLAASDPQFPLRLAEPSLGVAPAGSAPDDLDLWVGSGLYQAAQSRPDRSFLGRRVDHHWKDGQAGWVDSVELIVLTDPDVRAEALRDDYVDIAEAADGWALIASDRIVRPRRISDQVRLDDGRIAERWWRA